MNNFLKKLYDNHVLANLLFILILSLGYMVYGNMPREKDPAINFNWINVTTTFPGASAEDVETLITTPLEKAVAKVQNIKFISSNSRESISSILVRFNDIDTRTFDKRVNDLRREIETKQSELPKESEKSKILEITSANAYPTATLVVLSNSEDDHLRKQAKRIKEDLERMKGVDRVESFGLQDPELQILFNEKNLANYNLNAIDISQAIFAQFQDLSTGNTKISDEKWTTRWSGKQSYPEYIAKIPILTKVEELPLEKIAQIQRGREKPTSLVKYNNQSAVMLSIMKQADINTLNLVEDLKNYIKTQNNKGEQIGIKLKLLDDQTEITKSALSVMQTNAIFGLILVLFTTWLFLGTKFSILVSIGIPFTLAGTFIVLNLLGQTLNISALLGIVIALGMLVDDSVVVVEAIYFRISNGMDKMQAIIEALKEVFAPVTTSVLTTIAAFIPLMLLPGILGKFMLVIPLVVVIALLFSLIEAYWMLPAHVASLNYSKPSSYDKIQKIRTNATRWIKTKYTLLLIKLLRNPRRSFTGLGIIIFLAISIIALGLIKIDFFASDPLRIFYVNVEMEPGTSLEETLSKVTIIENKINKHLEQKEKRATASYAGFMFSQTEHLIGDHYGQVLVNLNPQNGKLRHVDDVINEMRHDITNTAGPNNISFLRLSGGPPTAKPVIIKVRGNNYSEIKLAVSQLKNILSKINHVFDITDDDSIGGNMLVLKPNFDVIHRLGINPQNIAKTLQLLVDGEVVNDFQDQGEKVKIRVKSINQNHSDANDLLRHSIFFNDNEIRLKELVYENKTSSPNNIKHYDLRRTINVSADIDKNKINTVKVNKIIMEEWNKISGAYPDIDLNFAGELDDIKESLDTLPILFLLGVGIIYLILGTQFKSYWQPLMILITIPLAFAGVTFGLFISRNPLSLFTMYGIVALSGITVNSAIVLISAANQRLENGMSLINATIYAARRRLIPILITSMTTIAGLFSLATGLGGQSLLWGPVATSIVWGLLFSTTLTLFFIPAIYKFFMQLKIKTA